MSWVYRVIRKGSLEKIAQVDTRSTSRDPQEYNTDRTPRKQYLSLNLPNSLLYRHHISRLVSCDHSSPMSAPLDRFDAAEIFAAASIDAISVEDAQPPTCRLKRCRFRSQRVLWLDCPLVQLAYSFTRHCEKPRSLCIRNDDRRTYRSREGGWLSSRFADVAYFGQYLEHLAVVVADVSDSCRIAGTAECRVVTA